MEPTTHRGRSGVEYPEATSLAIRAAASLSSKVRSAMPYSASTTGKAPNVSVSTASTPTSKKLRWSSAMTAGRVTARISLQPSKAGPPKSSAPSSRCWRLVPVAPSKMTTRSRRVSRKRPMISSGYRRVHENLYGVGPRLTVLMKVYTRKGDDGSTGLLYGSRVGKDSAGPSAYGEVDEAVSALGLARAETEAGSELGERLIRLPRGLFVAGAELATAPENRAKLTPGVSLVTAEMVAALEPIIDDVTSRYDPPQEFVLPGENRVAAALDLARCVVRRAERASVAASRDGWIEPGTSHVVPYLNRLADLVYTLARWQEGAWRPVRTP